MRSIERSIARVIDQWVNPSIDRLIGRQKSSIPSVDGISQAFRPQKAMYLDPKCLHTYTRPWPSRGRGRAVTVAVAKPWAVGRGRGRGHGRGRGPCAVAEAVAVGRSRGRGRGRAVAVAVVVAVGRGPQPWPWASKSTAKLNKSERQVIKRFKQREAERRKLVMANNAEQRKRTRKEIKRNASARHSGRTLALLALERLALAGLVQRTSVCLLYTSPSPRD